MAEPPLTGLTDSQTERSDWTSFEELIHELIGGSLRRNTFTRWELDLLLDLQAAGIRKSSRPELLRRYLKAIHRQQAPSADRPMRLSSFLESANPSRDANPSDRPLPLRKAS